MTEPTLPSGTPRTDPALLDALREDLAGSGYTVDGVEDLLGPLAASALHREEAVPALRATAGTADPRAALVRAFVLGVDVPRADLERALGRLGVAGAQALGLVEAAGEGPGDAVRARVDLRPYEAADGLDTGTAAADASGGTGGDAQGTVDWWVASDLGELATGRALRTDHVLGVGGASTTLAQVTVRDPRARALDLGTGCGIQALHAARHSRSVVGTDISRRALAFARFNADLAGVARDRFELRAGSMLDPVSGPDEPLFDLVVSNPPFVITPRSAAAGPQGDVPLYEYRDGGRAGDAIVRELVTGVGAVLAPGGVAQLLGNWEVRRGEAWHERVGEWVEESGLDGWVVQRELQDPAQYAETWIRDGGTTPDRDPEAWAQRYGAWLDDFASRDVEAVGFGIVTLRRPLDGPPTMRRLEEVTGGVRQPLGPAIAASLAAHAWLARRDDDALAREHLVVAADVTEERYLTPGHSDPSVVLLRQGGAFGRTVRAGTALAGLVGACDGELTVGQVVGALASLLGVGADDVAADVLPSVRGLVLDGLLAPAGA
ncbi:N5-glutamine methyltransferase family protein [Cellulomonas sp. NS3]|uniref:N5-glutamine methyltransferase family protein n=1 Tax=Cellulomonas sp. NS3 TaxID=2973977 RepID=UPI002162F9D2|nr:class I SAM-dependent methyltransferase [Cellulomonas sp. NS3]